MRVMACSVLQKKKRQNRSSLTTMGETDDLVRASWIQFLSHFHNFLFRCPLSTLLEHTQNVGFDGFFEFVKKYPRGEENSSRINSCQLGQEFYPFWIR